MRGERGPTSPASSHQGDGKPCETFEEIVWERHERKPVSLGNSTFARTSWTKVAERDVGDQIGYLGKLVREEVRPIAKTMKNQKANSPPKLQYRPR